MKSVISIQSLVERLFGASSKKEKLFVKHLTLVCEGILGARSPCLTDIARVALLSHSLQSALRWLSRLLTKAKVPWNDLRESMIAIAAFEVREDDFIAFDPGDIAKPTAKKMESLHRVHDGSEDICVNGYEIFSAEVIAYRGNRVFHFPMYQKIINARCEDYISQNAQICEGIYSILDHVNNRGIWLFDRGHDRSVIFKKVFMVKSEMRWVLRACENRTLIFEDDREIKILDHAAELIKKETDLYQIKSPQKSGYLKTCNFKGNLIIDSKSIKVTIVAIQDIRNKEPVVVITPMPAISNEDALRIFSHYLTRWGKEEGYRFEKSFLNLEKIRTHKLDSIQNMSLLVQMVYLWIAVTYKSMPDELEKYADQVLKHQDSINLVKYPYYRLGQAMRHRLFEQYPERTKYITSLSGAA